VCEARDGVGDGEGDGLGAGEPSVGEGLALGLGLGDAVPGEWLALGRLVRSGAGVVRWACGRAGGAVFDGGDDDVPAAGTSAAVGLLGGATST
jgi:hypothetical protein